MLGHPLAVAEMVRTDAQMLVDVHDRDPGQAAIAVIRAMNNDEIRDGLETAGDRAEVLGLEDQAAVGAVLIMALVALRRVRVGVRCCALEAAAAGHDRLGALVHKHVIGEVAAFVAPEGRAEGLVVGDDEDALGGLGALCLRGGEVALDHRS